MNVRDLTLASLGAAALTGLWTAPASAQQSVDYSDADNWLCRPDNPRACLVELESTIVHADGRLALETYSQGDPVVDCFYVYPTVSRDSTANSDMEAGPEEMSVIQSQFARMGSACRQFAPLYRQVTLTALRANMSDSEESLSADRELGYRDIRDAWEYYLREHNDGRGVVLIGHSQGAGVLSRLIAEEIEGSAAQDQILSAMLIGTTVRVPHGEIVGGTFDHMPLCQNGDDLGCIITYASFRSTAPPAAGSLFGRGNADTTAACTNPAMLAGDDINLHAYLASGADQAFSSAAEPGPWTTTGEEVNTPFVSVPGLLTAGCILDGEYSYLEITVEDDPADPRTDEITGDVLNPDGSVNQAWGLHLIDMNVAMGDLVTIIRRQTAAYLSR